MVCLERLFFISLCLTHVSFNCVFVFRITSQGGIRCCAITVYASLASFFIFVLREIRLCQVLCVCLGIFEMYNHIPAVSVASPGLHQQVYLGGARCLALLDLALGSMLYSRGHASLIVSYSLLSLSLNTRVPFSTLFRYCLCSRFLLVFLSPRSPLSILSPDWFHFSVSMLVHASRSR